MLGFNLNDILGPLNQQFDELITVLQNIDQKLEDCHGELVEIRNNTSGGINV